MTTRLLALGHMAKLLSAGGVHKGIPPILGELGVMSIDIGRPKSIDMGRASDTCSCPQSVAAAASESACSALAPACVPQQ